MGLVPCGGLRLRRSPLFASPSAPLTFAAHRKSRPRPRKSGPDEGFGRAWRGRFAALDFVSGGVSVSVWTGRKGESVNCLVFQEVLALYFTRTRARPGEKVKLGAIVKD